MKFREEDHTSLVLQELNKQRKQNTFCDVILHVDQEKKIPAHRCVLAAGSEYFRTMFSSGFSDSCSQDCTIPNANYDIMLVVVDFFYTGEIEILPQTVEDILKLSDYLCITKLKSFCAEILKKIIGNDNCLNIKLLADRYHLEKLSRDLMTYIEPRFGSLIQQQEIVELPFQFVQYLLNDHRLRYVREQDIFELIKKWVGHDSAKRSQHFKALFSLLEPCYLSLNYILGEVIEDPLVVDNTDEETVTKLKSLVTTKLSVSSDPAEVIICRSRSVKMGEEVQVLFYVIHNDVWKALHCPEHHCWDGLESMVCHMNSLYFLISKTEDMYGYMHHAEETKFFWRLDFRKESWERLPCPSHVKGQCRLISHVNGLYVIDRFGQIEEYDYVTGQWIMNGRPGFVDYPNATLYLMPMPADRYIYVLRAFSGGYSYTYAQTSFSLHVFDTVRHKWDMLSDIEAGDLNLEDHERFHGYTVKPGVILLKNELGQVRCQFDIPNRDWSPVSPKRLLPTFIQDIWGSSEYTDKVYVVGKSSLPNCPVFMMYDYGRRRLKAVSPPPCYLSGLLCHLQIPRNQLTNLASASAPVPLFIEPSL